MIEQVSEHVLRMRRITQSTVYLTLFEHTEDECGSVTTQVVVVGQGSNGTNSDTLGIQAVHSQVQDQVTDSDLDFLQWDCDHSSSLQLDHLASLLDKATQKYPTDLASFSLDISHVSTSVLSLFRMSLADPVWSTCISLALLSTRVCPNLSVTYLLLFSGP